MPTSIGAKIKAIAGLAHTSDVNERTSEFIADMDEKTQNGKTTSMLTEPQIKWIENIYRKHIGGAE